MEDGDLVVEEDVQGRAGDQTDYAYLFFANNIATGEEGYEGGLGSLALSARDSAADSRGWELAFVRKTNEALRLINVACVCANVCFVLRNRLFMLERKLPQTSGLNRKLHNHTQTSRLEPVYSR